MRRFLVYSLIAVLSAGFLTGCGRKEEAPAPATQEESPSGKAVKIDSATAVTVQGEVLFTGEVPQPREIKMGGNPECSAMQHGPVYSEEIVVSEGKLQNVIVYVKEGLENVEMPAPPEKAVILDQKECVFIPHVIAVQANQPIELLNSDNTLHNVNARPKNGSGFNIGFPVKGLKRTVKLAAAEIAVPIRCDIHPWMQGYIGVFPHPYFQVTGSDGAFQLANLPPGKYLIEAWHEKLGAQTQSIELGPRETKKISFTFSSD